MVERRIPCRMGETLRYDEVGSGRICSDLAPEGYASGVVPPRAA